MKKARRVQFAYIITGSGAMLASTLALLSAKVTYGFYQNPAECPGWNISSKSSCIPEEVPAAQEYAALYKDATIEAEILTQDEAFLSDSMSEIIEHPGELSPTIVAQNARASRIAIRQGKAARGSAAGSSMVLSERDEFLNELLPSTNAQDTDENASTVSGVPTKEARRSAAGSSTVVSGRDEFFDQRSSATDTYRMRYKGPYRPPYKLAPPNSDYKGGDRWIKVIYPNVEGGSIEPVIELPRPTIQNVAIQTSYPQLFRLEPGCNEWIKKIFELPETRQLDFAKDHTFKLDDMTYSFEPDRLEAALGQIRGVVARKPCDHCKSKTSKGPFATCVVVPGHDERFHGACCNCVYQRSFLRSKKCTLLDMTIAFRKPEDKAKHPLRAASVALRSYFPKLRSIKSLPAEDLKEANPQSAAAAQRLAERRWAAYPRGF